MVAIFVLKSQLFPYVCVSVSECWVFVWEWMSVHEHLFNFFLGADVTYVEYIRRHAYIRDVGCARRRGRAGICNIYNAQSDHIVCNILYFFLPSIDYHNLMKFHVSCPVFSLHFIFQIEFHVAFSIAVRRTQHTYTFSHTKRNPDTYVEIFVERKQFSSGFQAIFFISVSVGRRSANAYYTAFVKLRERAQGNSAILQWIFMPFWACNIVTQNMCVWLYGAGKEAASRFHCRKRKTHGYKRTIPFRMK